VAFFAGYTKEARPQLQRLAHAFGSPNYMTESGCCFSATMVAEKLTFGYKIKTTSTVASNKTRCLLVWSTNPRGSIPPFDEHPLANPKAGPALIVVDPRRTPLAEQADVHLQIRPGTDGALALGLHHHLRQRLAGSGVLDEWGQRRRAFRDYVRSSRRSGSRRSAASRPTTCSRRELFATTRRRRSCCRRRRRCSTATASRTTGR
jgi:anaerobic selenocysteine-containing dehydrogenase